VALATSQLQPQMVWLHRMIDKIAKALSNFANKPFAVSKSTGVLAD
jgi:hypothetical protein